ncbi:MAG: hypothetical protein JWP26_3531 [Devosia sp.]|uniref:hypothetical protein n=1 Tax=Devosia sp. TaxID=1871048 RepID=UPI0026167FC6|nr:hypothetical protein [Devosia sp.]MDB5588561.1 hypothetical protein [Devosia sp.]
MKPATLTKLTRILGMLGSEHAGERASAALAAHKLVGTLDLSWRELLEHPQASASKVVVKRIHEYGIEHHEAAEARMRQLKAENQKLTAELKTARRRLAVIAEQARKASMQDE